MVTSLIYGANYISQHSLWKESTKESWSNTSSIECWNNVKQDKKKCLLGEVY